ncbi:UNVERIFIED_CONTAM: Magnesium transporter MRS2-2 [Sesamum radiatum]|uniref:Magnesium transporter MRS2-2 n=1 Tax=Sesamum radiatum TaxID=300843 RepID=A0AAW2UBY1_SESRA
MVFEMAGREGGHMVPADAPNAVSVSVSVAGFKKKGAGSRSWILMDSSGQKLYWMLINTRSCTGCRFTLVISASSTLSCLTRLLFSDHIKAIITADEVLLRDPSDDIVVPIVEDLRRRLKSVNVNREVNGDGNLAVHNDVETAEEDDSPFEFRALEVALEAICSYLAARTIELETAVYPALDMLTSKISSRNLDRVRKLKSQMTRLTARVQKKKMLGSVD